MCLEGRLILCVGLQVRLLPLPGPGGGLKRVAFGRRVIRDVVLSSAVRLGGEGALPNQLVAGHGYHARWGVDLFGPDRSSQMVSRRAHANSHMSEGPRAAEDQFAGSARRAAWSCHHWWQGRERRANSTDDRETGFRSRTATAGTCCGERDPHPDSLSWLMEAAL